jgi:hypothetical protein
MHFMKKKETSFSSGAMKFLRLLRRNNSYSSRAASMMKSIKMVKKVLMIWRMFSVKTASS